MNAVNAVNTGDTAFVLICAGLVMLMTPGLAFFYGGMVRRKNILGILMQCFAVLVPAERAMGAVRLQPRVLARKLVHRRALVGRPERGRRRRRIRTMRRRSRTRRS